MTLDTTGLLLRYRADDISGAELSAVASWPEFYGGPAATQGTGANQPKLRLDAFNGHQAVEFDGTNDCLALAGAALDAARNRSDLTVFVAYRLPGTAVTGIRALFGLSVGTSTSARAVMHQREGTGVHQIAGRRLDADAFQGVTGGSSTTGETAVMTGIWRWSSSDAYLFKNGTQVASSTSFQTTGSTSDTASQAGFIGANAAGAEVFSGMIAEVLVYASADVSGALRANVHTYLEDTYAVQAVDYAGVMPTDTIYGAPAWVPMVSETFDTPFPVGAFTVNTGGALDGHIQTTAAPYARYGSKIKFYPDGYPDTYNVAKNYVSRTVSTTTAPGAAGVLDVWLHTETISGTATPLCSWQRLLLPGGATTKLYGRISVRMRADSAPDYGAVMLIIGEPWPDNGELDWPEGDLADPIHGFYHFANPAGGQTAVSPAWDPSWQDWHIYTQEWEPGRVRWYIDDVEVLDTTNQVSSGASKFGIIQTGGSAPGVIPGAGVSGHLQIDWIVYYDYAAELTAPATTPALVWHVLSGALSRRGRPNPREGLVYGDYEPEAPPLTAPGTNGPTAGILDASLLTDYNAPGTNTVTLTNGEVIENKIIYGDIFLPSSHTTNIYIRNCYLRGGDFTPSGADGVVNADSTRTGTGRLIIEDCEIYPIQEALNRDGVRGNRVELYRTWIHGTIDCVVPYALTSQNSGNAYFYMYGCVLEDMVYFYPDYQNGVSGAAYHSDGTHNDCVGFGGGKNIHIKGNLLKGTSHAGPGQNYSNATHPTLATTGYAQGACIIITNTVSNPLDNTAIIEDNYLYGGISQFNIKPNMVCVIRNNHHYRATHVSGAFHPGYWIRYDLETDGSYLAVTNPRWVDGPYAGQVLIEPRDRGIHKNTT